VLGRRLQVKTGFSSYNQDVRLLSIAFVLFASQSSAEVRVLVPLGQGLTPEIQEKLATTEPRIKELLGPDAWKKLVEAEGRAELSYQASQWASQPAGRRNEAIDALKAVWGEDGILFQEQAQALPPVPQEKPSLQARFADAGRSVDQNAAAASQDASAFFDGGAVRDAVGSWTPVQAKTASAGGLVLARPAPESLGREVPPPGPYEGFLQAEAKAAGLSPDVLRALLAAKGGFEARPSRVSGGSYGLLLITRAAANAVGMKGADLKDPETNIRVGAKLLSHLIDFFHGDVHRALAAYQVGTGKVVRSGGIPNDPEVKSFLAAYQRALRQGPAKPRVEPVVPVKAPALREALQQAVVPLPPASKPSKDPVARYRKTLELVAAKRGVDAKLLEAVLRAENPWGDPMRVSPAGAVGLMQLMPDTARQLGVDPRNPVQSIDGGARHLRWLLTLYGEDKVLAAAAYNAGHRRVKTRIPNIGETKRYVRKVFGYYEELGGEAVDVSSYMPPARRPAKKKKA